MRAFVPVPDLSKRSKKYHSDLFHYDAEENHYICPQGQMLKLYSQRKSEQVIVYKAGSQVCNSCPVKHECTESKSGRHIFRSIFQEYVDRVRTYHDTEDYQQAMRKRGVWVEPLFGEAKQFHRLWRLRRYPQPAGRRAGRGRRPSREPSSARSIEGLMVAAGQNLKRLLKHWAKNMVSGLIEDTREILGLFHQLLSRWFIAFQHTYSIRFSTGCSCCAILSASDLTGIK